MRIARPSWGMAPASPSWRMVCLLDSCMAASGSSAPLWTSTLVQGFLMFWRGWVGLGIQKCGISSAESLLRLTGSRVVQSAGSEELQEIF